MAANGRRGRPQGKCHREETAGAGRPAQARVKRCGKSAPRCRQRKRHGKPHREQDRIGAARVRGQPRHPARSSPPPGLVARGAEQSAPQRNGRRGGQPPDRTRLTGRLAVCRRQRARACDSRATCPSGGRVSAATACALAALPLLMRVVVRTGSGHGVAAFKGTGVAGRSPVTYVFTSKINILANVCL